MGNEITVILLQELPSVFLGPYGTIVLTVLAGVFGFFSWRQRNWRSAAEAAEKELAVQRERADRIDTENKRLLQDNASLQTKTDLKPLLDCIQGWTSEGRTRFDEANRRLDTVHIEQTTAMKALTIEIQSQRVQSESVFRDMTEAFRQHSHEDAVQMQRVAAILENVEKRLSESKQ